MTELGSIFAELGLSQYLDTFVEQGFDSWDIILDITESDFDILGVKLGHRRKLQRKIANSRGAVVRSTASPKRRAPSPDGNGEDERPASTKSDAKDGGSVTGKRKYRRHPKPDDNAPARPPSAYVIFSNKMREDLKGRHLSFTEIAKLVGENWQTLTAPEKESYEEQAASAKRKYNAELTEYKKTESYQRYAEYLLDFKAKQNSLQSGTARTPRKFIPPTSLTDSAADVAKRPKLENNVSNGSSGTTSSATSTYGQEPPKMRMGSIGSWQGASQEYTPNPLPSLPDLTIGRIHNSAPAPVAQSGSTAAPLPGYRDVVIGTAQPQTVAWRDGPREAMLPMNHYAPRRTSMASHPQSPIGSPMHSGMPVGQYANRRRGHSPPLLTTESTVASTNSNGSQGSMYYGPRTPLEPSLDRSLPIPSLYTSKVHGLPDSHLASFRPPSLSPQTSVNSSASPSYASPTTVVAMEYSNYNQRRGYLPPVQQLHASGPTGNSIPRASAIEETLDPVSALLRAGEIVNNASQKRPQP